MKYLYTIIIEFMGGTYVSQYLALTPQDAFLMAIENNIQNPELTDFNRQMLNKVDFWLKESGIGTLNGLNNIWYFSFLYKRKSHHCHIIETVK